MSIETTYNPKFTAEFIMECAKIANVRLMSHQIILSSDDTINMEKLDIPNDFVIERVYAGPGPYSQKHVATIVLKWLTVNTPQEIEK